MKAIKNILLLDKDPQSAGQIMNTLSVGKDAFAVQHAGGVLEGLTYLQLTSPDLVLLDGNMAESGDFAAVQTKLAQHNIPCILLSDNADKGIAGLAEKTGAREYVVKSGITPTHLLKTIVNTLRLSETENRLNLVFEEYSGRISSFSQMLDAFNAGAVVVNKGGAVQYTNARASALMNDEVLGKKLISALTYRPVKEMELTSLADRGIAIHISNIDWDSEACNLFIIESMQRQSSSDTEISMLVRLFNIIPGNRILMKNGTVEFANAGAASMLMLTGDELKGRRIETLLSTPAFRQVENTEGRDAKGVLAAANGSTIAVKYCVCNLNLGDEEFQLLEMTLSQLSEISGGLNEQPHESTGDNLLPAAMGNFGAPANSIVKDIQLMMNCITEGNLNRAAELALLAETGVNTMGNLLGEFKDYLTVGIQTPEVNEFSMKVIVEEALQFMQGKIDGAGAEINISELPALKADQKLVLQVLKELLNNALQFSRKDKKPVIDIGHDKYEGSYIFCIRDNGIGISRKDHAIIFEPFAKLDALNQNNGLGLAICKSIVEKHGGKIWVESMPGHGSNFYFTLGENQ